MIKRGRLIVLEGGEGAGKSTHARGIRAWLEQQGREVVQTREPGGSPLAEAIRGVVLGDWLEGIDATTELLLIFAARAAHLHALIRPALEQGKDVVCDRFVDASYAYQGAARGLGSDTIAALERLTLGELRPDLVLLLDIDPQEGLKRAKRRGDENRFEAETLEFMGKVRAEYLRRARAEPARYAVIDAARPQAQVAADLRRELEARL
ncbi:dTMP kinase [Nevskia soli]|uniref:dTMP kinase n=1 Tax=Nevskia soli TaxID=418856 RepID=UPI0004A762DE|nr:dTMP kinase [Nevskia soli]